MDVDSTTARPTDPTLLAYWLMAQAALRESPTGVDGLASAVLALIQRCAAPAGPPVLCDIAGGQCYEQPAHPYIANGRRRVFCAQHAYGVPAESAEAALASLRESVRLVQHEIECRIGHGAASGGHLEYVRTRLDALGAAELRAPAPAPAPATVYLVTHYSYDEFTLHGVFASEAEAQRLATHLGNADVESHPLLASADARLRIRVFLRREDGAQTRAPSPVAPDASALRHLGVHEGFTDTASGPYLMSDGTTTADRTRAYWDRLRNGPWDEFITDVQTGDVDEAVRVARARLAAILAAGAWGDETRARLAAEMEARRP